jgi:putative ATP-dependent endonuclease of OLD family
VTFCDLTEQERQLFDHYIHGDELVVTKIIERNSERYHGTRLQHPEFLEIRQLTSKTDRRNLYMELRRREPYIDLPSVRSADEAESAMSQWEQEHPELCQLILDDGRFFGFRQVGQARLERFTRFVLVPAVRDAEEDAADSKGSAIYQLMELVVRSTLEQNEQFSEVRARVQEEYSNFLSPESIPQLDGLQSRLTSILQNYVPSAAVLLDWISGDQILLPTPRAQVRLREDRFEASVDRVGHGLQRAFILSLLQSLASITWKHAEAAQTTEGETGEEQIDLIPDLILGIEEPELYQHPSRQRSLSKILHQLSTGQIPGVARRTQIIYCTHSPLFIDIARFQCVRRFHKVNHPSNPNLPMITWVQAVYPIKIAQQLQAVQDVQPAEPFTAESLSSRLATIMTPIINEGFFSDVVVLVEGDEDRAALLGCALQMGIDLESEGVSVIPCSGKTNIDRPFLVFFALGIPTYVIFDSDSDKGKNGHPETNRCLQRLLSIDHVVDFPQKYISDNYSIFDPNLSKLLESKAGEDIFKKVLEKFEREYGYKKRDCSKSPTFIKNLIDCMANEGRNMIELGSIVFQLKNLLPDRETIVIPETAG